MKEIGIESLNDNVFSLMGKEWMLVAAGTPDNFNMMTASWGCLGWLWNRPVAFVFIRPERHTFGFAENNAAMTLSFLGNDRKMRELYNLLGTKSGRDIDKMHLEGLTPTPAPLGSVMFEESRLTIVGRKLFITDMKECNFLDKSVLERWYGETEGLHRIYVVQIEKVFASTE
ncbi:MAG: flavin reductase [Bacteroidales bacterium]|nr:flavin reductase [Bacteroidales bacterium]